MRRQFTLFIGVIACLFIVSGCGFLGKTSEKSKEEETTTEKKLDPEKNSVETSNGYGFTTFDLEIEVDQQDVIEVQFDANDLSDAKYVNKLENSHLQNADAQNTLDTFFSKIHLTNETDKPTIKEDILQWFKLDTYTGFELEVLFDDGTVLKVDDYK